MAESTFTLNEYFNTMLSYDELLEANAVYSKAIENTDFKLPNKDTLEFMLWAKRDKICFGPYQNLTFFEISNRIYSDLVLFKAAQVLFEEHQIKSIQLKMSNHSGSDLIVIDKDNNKIKGEAFNTAPSFFQIKMRKELGKLKNEPNGIIAFNECALSEKNRVFFERKKIEYPKVLFVVCEI